MDRYSIEIFKIALQDIANIRNNIIATFGYVEDADVVEQYIYDTIQQLSQMPDAHRLFVYNDKLRTNFRVITARKKYDIYYRVNHQAKIVEVLHVVHHKRDIKRIFHIEP